MTPFSTGVRIHDHIITPDAFTAAQLADAMYRLTADADGAALILESCTMEDADALLNPGVQLIAEAVTAVKNRLDRTMSALVRVFARHGNNVKPYDYPSIGPDRKNALFAYKTVTFTFDDGQTVSILFHSPGRDPMKLVADDTLIAYRWMLNRRDITAIVSPERGRDINLQTMARRIMQLVEENSEKFQANNEKRQEQSEALAKLERDQAAENEAVDKLTQQNADLSGQIEEADALIARLRKRLGAHGEGDREGSGAGAESTVTPSSGGDVARGVAARAGLDALRMGRGHRVDGIEYNRTNNGTEVVVGGQVAALVKGRLSKSSIEAALHQVAANTIAESLEAFGEALKAQLNLPAGHTLEFETAAEVMRRAETMGGNSSTNESVHIRRDATAVGGYSGSARLIINDRRAEVAIFLTNEATGVTEDRATVLNGDNLSQLINRTAEHLNGKFAGGQAEQPSDTAGAEDEPHYSELILKALQEHHGWNRDNSLRPDGGDPLSVSKDVGGSVSGSINPEGKRIVTATFRNDEDRRRYLALINGFEEAFDIDGRDALGKGEEGAAAVAAKFDRMTIKWAQDNAADPSTLKVSQPEPKPQPEPEGNSDRVADYLSRIEQAETAKDVGAIGIEVENDANLSPEEDQAVRDAIRDARVAIEQAERESGIPTGEDGMPEGFKEVANHYNSDNEQVAAYGEFAEGDTVAMKSNPSLTGEIVGHVGTGPVIREHLVRWSNGVEARLHHTDLVASTGQVAETAPENLEALDSSLYRDISRSISVIRSIDNGTDKGFNRSLFSSSIANKLKTQARNGNDDVVNAALLLIAQQSIEHGRPILARRNAIWSVTGNDMDFYTAIAQRQASADPTPVASEEGDAPAPEEQDDSPAPAEPESESTPTEEDRISAALQALLSETDSTEAMDTLEKLMDEAEAAGIDIDNDPDMLAASDHVTHLLEQEAA
ncbi:hypothetical protein ACT3R7_12000 [Halomonas sp. AOP43-A1-21]